MMPMPMTEVKKDEIDAVSFYKYAGKINDFFDFKRFSSNLMYDWSYVMSNMTFMMRVIRFINFIVAYPVRTCANKNSTLFYNKKDIKEYVVVVIFLHKDLFCRN